MRGDLPVADLAGPFDPVVVDAGGGPGSGDPASCGALSTRAGVGGGAGSGMLRGLAGPADSRRSPVVPVVRSFVRLAFTPLLSAGIADDLVAGLRVAAYGGRTAGHAGHDDRRVHRSDQAVASRRSHDRDRGSGGAAAERLSGIARTWAVGVLGCAFLPAASTPCNHFYLGFPSYW